MRSVSLLETLKSLMRTINTILSKTGSRQTGSVSEEVTRRRESHPIQSDPAAGNNNKVLVVDDSAVSRKVVKLALERNGYEIFEAKNGLEALTRLNIQKPDLVLLDIIMPGMDG